MMRMDPEVFFTTCHEVEMALLREYDIAANEIPYAINIGGPVDTTIRELKDHPLMTWELADSVVMAFARGLLDDDFHTLRATCFFDSGHVIVPVSVTRANGKAFSLMDAFHEMVLDRASPAKT